MEMGFHLLRRAGYDEGAVSEAARTMGYEETPRLLPRRRGDRRARDPRADIGFFVEPGLPKPITLDAPPREVCVWIVGAVSPL
jgi:hypothetical protein